MSALGSNKEPSLGSSSVIGDRTTDCQASKSHVTKKASRRYAALDNLEDFQRAHAGWIEHALLEDREVREDRWSEAIAVGSLRFVESVKLDLRSKAISRSVDGNPSVRVVLVSFAE